MATRTVAVQFNEREYEDLILIQNFLRARSIDPGKIRLATVLRYGLELALIEANTSALVRAALTKVEGV